MRTPLIAGNWKMNTTVAEARQLAFALLRGINAIDGIEKVLCPPFISLATVKEAIKGSSLKLGAQNMYFKEKGAFTGEVSPLMLRDLCEYVILGHSERRHILGEDDQLVNQKVKAAKGSGLKPILCVGETLEELEGGKTREVLVRQVTLGLDGVEDAPGLAVAYEPVWAIGTGRPATGKDANQTIGMLRDTLGGVLGSQAAMDTRILYGGSVTSENIREFISQPEIDGALVGGASLKLDDFIEIVRSSAQIKKS